MSVDTEQRKPKDLDEAWENARKAFLARTNLELFPDAQHTLDSVLAALDAKYNPDPSKIAAVETKKRIKDNIIKVCSVVNILGSVTAQGASAVFGASNTCFSAIALLLEAPGKIYKVYDGLADLFEEIAHFLVRFDVLKQIDAEGLLDEVLINNSNDLLIKLVEICGLMISLIRKSSWTKFKTGLKAALMNDDSGVNEALENFRRLADRQGAIIQDFNLYHAARADASMGRLEPKVELVWEDISSRRNKESSKERLRSLAIKLNVPLDDLENLTTTPQTKLHDSARKLFPGSQEWLNCVIPYVEWKKSRPGLHRLLHVSSEPQGGKSSFLASVFSDALGSDTEILVGHYDCGQLPVYVSHSDEVSATESSLALKAIALQLAQVNQDYAAKLEEGLAETLLSDDDKLETVWERLFSVKQKSLSDMKVLMLFDNVDKLPIEVCEEFMSVVYEKCDQMMENRSLAIWAVTAAHPRMLRQMSTKSFIQMSLHEHSAPLIDKHVLRVIETHATLRQQHPGIVRLRSELQNRLTRLAQGDFGFINKRIDHLVKCVNSGEDSLDTLLSIMTEDPAAEQGQAIRQLFKNLEQSLNPREIDHLNILLQWTMYSGRKHTLEELEQALLLTSETDHLLPLEGKMRLRYSDVFDIEDGWVSLKDDVANYLKAMSTSTQTSETDAARISLNIKIENASSTAVRQFFWKLSNAASAGDLQMDFATSLHGSSRPVISISATDAYATVTSQCLKLLTDDEGSKKYGALINCALQILPHLLDELRKIAEAGRLAPSTKQMIVQRLINLLRDTESWVRLFRAHENLDLWYRWQQFREVSDNLQYWFTESEALQLMEPIDKRWSRAQMALEKGPAGFWEPFTIEVARMWLREREVSTVQCFQWIVRFRDKQTGVPPGPSFAGLDYWQPKIRAAAAWSVKVIGLQSWDSLYFERLGHSFLDVLHGNMTPESKNRWSQAAIDQLSQAKAYGSPDWRVDRGMAIAYNNLKKNDLATESMLQGVAKLQSYIAANQHDQKGRENLLAELKRLANWKASAGDHKHASQLYDQVLDISPYDYGCHWRRFRCLCEAKEEGNARATLLNLAGKEGKQAGLTQLAESLHRFISGALDGATVGDDMTSSLLDVVEDEELRSKILDAIHDNLIYAQHQKRPFDQAKMLLLQGLVIARGASTELELEKAQQAWRKCILLCEGHSNLAKWLSIYRLALRWEAQYHFGRLTTASAVIKDADIQSHEYYLRRIAKAATRAYGVAYYSPATYLIAYNWLNGREKTARKKLLSGLEKAIEILSDDDPYNDNRGYHILACTLNHAGDPLNALSAFSLLGPPKSASSPNSANSPKEAKKAVPVPLSFFCDGLCRKKWKYADDMWVCKYCPGTDFCTPCKEKLQQGKLERFWCSPKHDWLHVPPASVLEADPVPEGYVRVGGQMDGDRRVGGEVVEIQVWLDKLHQEWKDSIGGLAENPDVEDDAT